MVWDNGGGQGRSVLILDDIVESGSALRRAAEVVVKEGNAASA